MSYVNSKQVLKLRNDVVIKILLTYLSPSAFNSNKALALWMVLQEAEVFRFSASLFHYINYLLRQIRDYALYELTIVPYLIILAYKRPAEIVCHI